MTAAMTWCSQCFAVPGPPPGRWTPPPAQQVVIPQVSRWRGGQTSFGPVGRVACTLAWVLPLALFVFSGSLLGLGAWLLVGPFWLRATWRAARVA